MPKMKTNRSAAKRFTKTGSGKVKRGSAFKRHLLTRKTPKAKRQLRGVAYVHPASNRDIKRLLPGA